jgi:hypothetical protein
LKERLYLSSSSEIPLKFRRQPATEPGKAMHRKIIAAFIEKQGKTQMHFVRNPQFSSVLKQVAHKA